MFIQRAQKNDKNNIKKNVPQYSLRFTVYGILAFTRNICKNNRKSEQAHQQQHQKLCVLDA